MGEVKGEGWGIEGFGKRSGEVGVSGDGVEKGGEEGEGVGREFKKREGGRGGEGKVVEWGKGGGEELEGKYKGVRDWVKGEEGEVGGVGINRGNVGDDEEGVKKGMSERRGEVKGEGEGVGGVSGEEGKVKGVKEGYEGGKEVGGNMG